MADINSVLIEGTVAGMSRPYLRSDIHDRVLEIGIRTDMDNGYEPLEIAIQCYDSLSDKAGKELENGMKVRIAGKLRPVIVNGNNTFCIEADCLEYRRK